MNKIKTYDLIVSIGAACSCTQILRFNNLQEFSYPLDWLAGSGFLRRIEIIVSLFKNFLNKEDLVFSYTEKAISCDAYKNVFNDLVFNHDFPQGIPLDKSYGDVKAKYDRRISRLLNKIRSSQHVLFVYIETPNMETSFLNTVFIKAQEDIQRIFPNVECDLLYVKHDGNLQLNDLIYEELSERVLKVTLFNKDLRKGAPDYAVNFQSLMNIFNKYKLNKQAN